MFSLERAHIGIYKSVISDLVSIFSLARLNGVDLPQENERLKL